MRTIASLFATIGVLIVCEIEGGVHNGGGCEKFCCNGSEHDLKNCCRKAELYVVPLPRFYTNRCMKKFVMFCTAQNNSSRNLTSIQEMCCAHRNHNCSSHNSTGLREHKISVEWKKERFWAKPKINYNEWNLTQAELFLKMATQGCLNDELNQTQSALSVQYRYPVFKSLQRYKRDKRFVYGSFTPTPYLVMRKESYDILTVVRESSKHLWPTVCVCVTWTLISGIVIWLLDHRKNSIEFPTTFYKGVLEGAWWAMVTMTTVGYGDRSPKSLLARIYAAAWMIIGMMILSTFTAEVSSGLVTKGMITHETTIGRSIGVPEGSRLFSRKKFSEATITEFNTVQKLEEHLEHGEASNRIVLYSCKARNVSNSNKQIVQVLKPHIVAIQLMKIKNMNPTREDDIQYEDQLAKCMRKKVETFLNYAGPEEEEVEDENESEETKCDFEKSNHSKLKEFQPFGMKAIVIYASASLVVVTFVVGIVFDLTRSRRQKFYTQADVEACWGRKRYAVEKTMERRAEKERKDEMELSAVPGIMG